MPVAQQPTSLNETSYYQQYSPGQPALSANLLSGQRLVTSTVQLSESRHPVDFYRAPVVSMQEVAELNAPQTQAHRQPLSNLNDQPNVSNLNIWPQPGMSPYGAPPPQLSPHQGPQYYPSTSEAYVNSGQEGRRIDLSKWGVRFDGTSKTVNVHEFLFRVEQRRVDNNCSEADLLRDICDLLSGSALEFYWNWRKLSPIQDWRELQKALLSQFQRYDNEFQVQVQILRVENFMSIHRQQPRNRCSHPFRG